MASGGGSDRRWIALLVVLVATVSASGAAGAAGASVDPFYLDLLREGNEAYERANHDVAAELLKISCFGLLTEPDLLNECLVTLALSHAARGDVEAFIQTFRRVADVESRFRSYSEGELAADRRESFEIAMARYIPKRELALLPTFQALAERAAETRVKRLPPRERRTAIDSRLREHPGDAVYLQMLAELEVAERRYRRAIETLDSLLAAEPEHAAGRCLRGRVLAAERQCVAAIGDLPACSGLPEEVEGAALELECLIRERRWTDASARLDDLPAETLAAPAVAGLAARVAAETASREAAASPPADEEVAEASAVAPAPEPAPALEPELAELRQQITAVRSLDELNPLALRARRLADENPGSSEAQFLAGEFAYLAKRWEEAAMLFRRAGEPARDRSLLRFYMAVAFFESGDAASAASLLESALPGLERTPFVQGYIDRILGSTADG